MTNRISTMLVGLGNVGRALLGILAEKTPLLESRYGLRFDVVCVADSSGVAVAPEGLDPAQLRLWKESGKRVVDLLDHQPGLTPVAYLATSGCDLLLEASPVNLVDGEPGLSIVRTALCRGIPAVLANKGPLVLAHGELEQMAWQKGTVLAYSATVCGGLPVVNIVRRDLVAARVQRLRGIFNSTSNFVLGAMETGTPYASALAEAQRRGIAEADPSLDVEGWDTANKLVILANTFLGIRVSLADVDVRGIDGVTPEQVRTCRERGEALKLVASAQRVDAGYRLAVAPTALPADDFLASCTGWDMGVEIQSDLYGVMYHKIREETPVPTAAAMLRDAVNLMAPRL